MEEIIKKIHKKKVYKKYILHFKLKIMSLFKYKFNHNLLISLIIVVVQIKIITTFQ